MLRLLPLCLFVVACGAPLPTPDASTPSDAGTTDAGTLDAGFDAGVPDAGTVTTLRVTYPATAQTLFVRGSRAPLSWDTGVPMQKLDATTWALTVPNLGGDLEWKPLLDDATWSKGPNYRAAVGATVEIAPRFFRDVGEWSIRWRLTSSILNNTRGVYVYLPPTYLENSTARMPVVYMHDGQNLFDPAAAFGGVTWGVPETMDSAAGDGRFREAIIVGPENMGAARIPEYTPTVDAMYGDGGRGDLYLRLLVEELKPKVDAELRTKPGREDTVIIGSSLGGLISSCAGVRHPEVFGVIGSMSPSVWWDNRVLLTMLPMTVSPKPVRVYVDSGDQNDGQADTADLAAAYRALGYVDGTTLKYVLQPGAAHTESAWASRLPAAFEFLLGPAR